MAPGNSSEQVKFACEHALLHCGRTEDARRCSGSGSSAGSRFPHGGGVARSRCPRRLGEWREGSCVAV